jgi:hypothetical protein
VSGKQPQPPCSKSAHESDDSFDSSDTNSFKDSHGPVGHAKSSSSSSSSSFSSMRTQVGSSNSNRTLDLAAALEVAEVLAAFDDQQQHDTTAAAKGFELFRRCSQVRGAIKPAVTGDSPVEASTNSPGRSFDSSSSGGGGSKKGWQLFLSPRAAGAQFAAASQHTGPVIAEVLLTARKPTVVSKRLPGKANSSSSSSSSGGGGGKLRRHISSMFKSLPVLQANEL